MAHFFPRREGQTAGFGRLHFPDPGHFGIPVFEPQPFSFLLKMSFPAGQPEITFLMGKNKAKPSELNSPQPHGPGWPSGLP